jgi:rfaE bifunctional protein kinase chain/domain
MNQIRLDELLEQFSDLHVLVVGDFFLDKYLIIDRQLSKASLETGLEAYQVVDIRYSPGVAGTVTSNLRGLGVKVTALGVIGEDGQGYELRRGLAETGVGVEYLLERPDLFTPTYTKPMVRERDGREHEIQRLDIKNRSPLPVGAEEAIVDLLQTLVPQVDGVVVADQVSEANCGVITDRVRAEIGALALRYPSVIFAADSRARIGLHRHVIVMPNAREAVLAVHPDWTGVISLELARESGAELFRRNDKLVFLTLGARGILVFTEAGCEHVPAVPVSSEIDIVGAGDSAMAGVVSALCSGATAAEAAMLGNLVASVTIQQIGATGTATPEQVREQFQRLGMDVGVDRSQNTLTLEQVARRLDGSGVPWAVFAGAAAAVYGASRPLTDVDILVPAAEGERVAALFPEAQVKRSGHGVQVVLLPGFDVLVGLTLMDLDAQMAARLTRHQITGVSVPVIPPEDNILLKAVWGRGAEEGKHDWEDVEAMMTHLPSLDWEYLRWRASTFLAGPQGAAFAPAEHVQQVLDRLHELWRRRGVARRENNAQTEADRWAE